MVPDARHVAVALTGSASPKVRAAGLRWMARAVPEGFRKLFAEEGGLFPAQVALADKDPKIVEAALDVFEVYDFPRKNYLKDSLDPSMPESLKQRAAKLFGAGAAR
jgi:hypothetical protein